MKDEPGEAPGTPKALTEPLECPAPPEVRAALGRVVERVERSHEGVRSSGREVLVSFLRSRRLRLHRWWSRATHGLQRWWSRTNLGFPSFERAPRRRPRHAQRKSSVLVAAKPVGIAVLVAGIVGIGVVLFNHHDNAAPPATRAVANDRPLPTVPGTEPVYIPKPVTPPTTAPSPGSAAPSTLPPPIADPVAVVIPAVRVAAPIEPLGLDRNGALQVPTDFNRVGWYSEGPQPGGPGAAVLEGHVDSYAGPAVFYGLSKLRPGDEVTVRRSDGSQATFSVQRSASYSKKDFPTNDVYAPAEKPSLRLITCTGAFDKSAGSYQDNLVVYATLKG